MILVALLMILGLLLVLKKIRIKGQENLPPGPWGFPVVGHLPLLGLNPLRTLDQWKEKYGPIVYCRMGSYPCVILFGSKLTKEAFKMPEFSGRPSFQVTEEAGGPKGFVFSEGLYNTQLHQFTRASFNKLGVGRESFGVTIHEGISQLLRFIKRVEGRPVKSEDIPKSHSLRAFWSVLTSEPLNEEATEHLFHVVETKLIRLGSLVPELVNLMPWINTLTRFLTFGRISFTRTRAEGALEIFKYVDSYVQRQQERWVQGQGQGQGQDQQPKNIMDMYFQQMDKAETDPHLPFYPSRHSTTHVIANLVGPALHTFQTAFMWGLYYLAANPSVQKGLQEEIDRVIGTCRLPTLADRAQDQMSYTENMILELLRIVPFSAFYLPHKVVKDVSFHGYTIPKGTMVLANSHEIHHSKDVLGDPEVFRPERWEGEHGKQLRREHFIPFSTGRRKCPGDRFSMDQLFLYVTTLCQQYSMELYGEESKQVPCITGLTTNPSEFRIIFSPRQP